MRFAFVFKILLCISVGFFVEAAAEATVIRVRLLTAQDSAQISARAFKIFVEHGKCLDPFVKINDEEGEFVIRKRTSGWTVFNTKSKQVCEIHSQNLKVAAEQIELNRRPVPNRLAFIAQPRGFDIVASLDLDAYLIGVLSKEMPSSFPLEAFKAQAIASRSYALKKVLTSKAKHFDLDSGVADQVFEYSKGNEKIKLAVIETKNLVLKNRKGLLFPVYFHSDCGGQTEEASEVWTAGEKGGTVVDSACPLDARSSWKFSISKLELTARLRVILNLENSQITQIKEYENSSSGRKKSLRFVLDDGSTRTITGQQLRNILGFDRLKSTLFAFKDSSSSFLFEGKGHGHGVGMCQWGARHLANSGKEYQSILKHYYPMAKLAPIEEPHKRRDAPKSSFGMPSENSSESLAQD